MRTKMEEKNKCKRGKKKKSDKTKNCDLVGIEPMLGLKV